MKGLVGVALVALHAVTFVVVVPAFHSAELVLEIPAGLSIGPQPSGTLPSGLEDRAKRELVGTAGLRHARYSVTYRGGYTRSVGVSGLVGPFQDPAKPVQWACRAVATAARRRQADGKTIANEISARCARARRASIAVLGKFEKVKNVTLRCSCTAIPTTGSRTAPNGYGERPHGVRAHRGADVVALIPEPSREAQLKVRARNSNSATARCSGCPTRSVATSSRPDSRAARSMAR
jgi:hypothetical protein